MTFSCKVYKLLGILPLLRIETYLTEDAVIHNAGGHFELAPDGTEEEEEYEDRAAVFGFGVS